MYNFYLLIFFSQIGAAYNKDAFVQNELVLAALKTACDHLNKGGVFCTKVYRSVDYNALMWVLQQLFEEVQTMKPNSSRSQSSEIFVICVNYISPKSVDPKLFDPNHVFKEVEDPSLKTVDVLHKKYDSTYKRQRSGYDDSLGMTLRAICSITDFMHSKDPVRLLTDMNSITSSSVDCVKYYEHPLTTPEFKLAMSDLKVLGKIDFKKLLKWRQQLRDIFHPIEQPVKKEKQDIEVEDLLSPEEKIQEEITQLRINQELQAQKDKKKKSQLLAKERVRQAYGMNNNAFEVSQDQELFSLDARMTKKQLNTMSDVKLDEDEDFVNVVGNTIIDNADVSASATASKKNNLIVLPEDGLEDELEEDYMQFMQRRHTKQQLYSERSGGKVKDTSLLEDTHTAKQLRKKDTAKSRIQSKVEEDEAFMDEINDDESNLEDANAEGFDSELEETQDLGNYHLKSRKQQNVSLHQELQEYLEHLSGNQVSSKSNKKKGASVSDNESSSSDDDDDKFVSRDEASLHTKTGKWFANPLFSTTSNLLEQHEADNIVESVENYMPKTDKEKRKEKRQKDLARNEKKSLKKRQLDAMLHNEDDSDHEGDEGSKKKKKLVLSSTVTADGTTTTKKQEFEIVPKSYRPQNPSRTENSDDSEAEGQAQLVNQPTRFDSRQYDSDEEDYDNHDRMMTLALGTYMLQPSRKKAMIDASYNRYAWNDPTGLPSWFLDDEMRHNKPQIPVPNALLDQVRIIIANTILILTIFFFFKIKNKYQLTGTKVVKKVAEARARKKRRALLKLKAAKKQANLMADNSELNERQKVKVK